LFATAPAGTPTPSILKNLAYLSEVLLVTTPVAGCCAAGGVSGGGGGGGDGGGGGALELGAWVRAQHGDGHTRKRHTALDLRIDVPLWLRNTRLRLGRSRLGQRACTALHTAAQGLTANKQSSQAAVSEEEGRAAAVFGRVCHLFSLASSSVSVTSKSSSLLRNKMALRPAPTIVTNPVARHALVHRIHAAVAAVREVVQQASGVCREHAHLRRSVLSQLLTLTRTAQRAQASVKLNAPGRRSAARTRTLHKGTNGCRARVRRPTATCGNQFAQPQRARAMRGARRARC
jgi:hypothetical protein